MCAPRRGDGAVRCVVLTWVPRANIRAGPLVVAADAVAVLTVTLHEWARRHYSALPNISPEGSQSR